MNIQRNFISSVCCCNCLQNKMCDYQWVSCWIWWMQPLMHRIVETLWFTIKSEQFILWETILFLLPLTLLLSQEKAAQILHLLLLSSNLALPKIESSKVHLIQCNMLWLQINGRLGVFFFFSSPFGPEYHLILVDGYSKIRIINIIRICGRVLGRPSPICSIHRLLGWDGMALFLWGC